MPRARLPRMRGTRVLRARRIPAAALAAAEARATENRNSYLRAVAELENFRKRSEREIENARKFAIERFAQELVTVGDALEAGINAGSANPGPALLEGAQATLRQLHRAFDKAGIKIIDPQGQPFDPEWHEAMVAQESRGSAGQYGVVGDSKGLFPERPLAAPGPGHRQQGAGRRRQLKNAARSPT